MSAGNSTTDHGRCHDSVHVESGTLVPSAVMFAAGVMGNILALLLLEVRRRRTECSLYQVLVTALLLTDLFGSVSVSPAVLAAYIRGKTLVGMSANKELCSYFGFSMTFFSLCTLGILCAIALERYLSIGHPYVYVQRLSTRSAYVAIALIYLGSALFCLTPFLGFGDYVQYCPGTWCFLEMGQTQGRDTVYVVFYASLILIMSSTTVVCNICVIYQLVMMHRRGKVHRRGLSAPSRHHRSMTEEVANLLPLAAITVVFICCTSLLVVRVYKNLSCVNCKECHLADLRALRLLSFHSIINPWVFIILRPAVLKILWKKLHKPQRSQQMGGNAVQLQKQEIDTISGHGWVAEGVTLSCHV